MLGEAKTPMDRHSPKAPEDHPPKPEELSQLTWVLVCVRALQPLAHIHTRHLRITLARFCRAAFAPTGLMRRKSLLSFDTAFKQILSRQGRGIRLQGCLTYKKTHPPWDPAVGLCLWS